MAPQYIPGHRGLTANKRRERWKICQSEMGTLIKCHWDIDNLLWMPHAIWFSVLVQLTFTQSTLRILQYQFIVHALFIFRHLLLKLYFIVRNLDFESSKTDSRVHLEDRFVHYYSAPRESMSTFSGWSKWCGSCRTWCGTCRKGITKMCAKGQGAQLHRIMWTSYGSLAAQSWLLLLGQTVHRCSAHRERFGSCE